EVGIAFGEIEFAQKLAVQVQAIRIEAVIRRQETPPGALGGTDLAPQRAVPEGLIADEADALHARDIALVDLEDEIDAALLQIDDLGLDRGIVAAAAPIDGQD